MRRSLFDYVETIAQIVPEVVTMLRTTNQQGFIAVTEKLLVYAITHLEQQVNNLRTSKEDTITAAAIGFFNRSAFGPAASRTAGDM